MILGMIGVALAAAIVTYLVLRVVRPPKHRVAAPPTTVENSTSTTSSTVPAGPAITQAQLDRLTQRLVPFVEKTRQLKFTSPPKPKLDDDLAYTRSFRASLARNDALMRRLTVPFEVLGMNPNDVSLTDALQTFYGDKTVAFYDPVTNELHVRAVPATPYLSTMLVVSLTEQLDDQHFTVDRVARPSGFGDGVIGLRTLLEGDGWRVANLWINRQSAADRSRAEDELKARRGGDANTSRVPAALSDWLRIPIQDGVSFTSDLVTSTSSSPLDAAFRHPPDGAAQITSPARLPSADSPASGRDTGGGRNSEGHGRSRTVLPAGGPPGSGTR